MSILQRSPTMDDGTVEQFVRALEDGSMEAACIFQNYTKTGQLMNSHAEVYCISNGVANFEVSFSRDSCNAKFDIHV